MMNDILATQKNNKIAASIEASPKQCLDEADLEGLFPEHTKVYLTDLGTDSIDTITMAAKRLRNCGYEPVPHIAVRRLSSLDELETRLKQLTNNANVKCTLVVGGGVSKPTGPFSCTLEALQTGLFSQYGITSIAIAGHPEGSPDFTESVALNALLDKQELAANHGINMHIITQFGFDAEKFIQWADTLPANGVNLPVHIGVSGPAKLTTLLKYAALCGVGNSIIFLKRNAFSLAALASKYAPETVVEPIEEHVRLQQNTQITQIHAFPFGGLKQTSQWLKDRGSW